MIDFNILHGLSTELFSAPGVVNPDLIIEEGCWYLCTDTAELFLGVVDQDKFDLKKINANVTEQVVTGITKLEITDGNLIATYADGTIADLGKVVDSVPTKLSELENDAGYITAAEMPKVDLSSYALKSEIPDVSGFIKSIPSEYITEAELNAKGYLTEHIDISGKADKVHSHPEYLTAHQDISHLAPKASIPTKVSQLENDADYLTTIPDKYITDSELEAKGYLTEHQSLANYATKQHVEDRITANKPDLSLYALNSALPTKTSQLTNDSGYITAIPSEYLTEAELVTELTNKGYLTATQAAGIYATKGEIPSLDDYATEQFVIDAINQAELDGSDTEIDLSIYAKLEDLPEVPTNISAFTNDAGYITADDVAENVDFSGLLPKVNNDDAYLWYVTTSNAKQELPNYIPVEKTDTDLDTQIGGKPLNNNVIALRDGLHLRVPTTPTDEGHATSKAYVDSKAAAVKNELLNGAGAAYDTLKELGDLFESNKNTLENLQTIASGKADAEHTHAEYLTSTALDGYLKTIPSEYITESELSGELAAYATQQYVTEAIAEHAAIKEEVTEVKTQLNEVLPIVPTVQELAEKAATQEWVNEQGFITDISGKADAEHTHTEYAPIEHTHDEYLTEHQDISGKSDVGHTHTLSEITDYSAPEIPEVDLTGYATTEITDTLSEAINTKTDDIPFKTDYFVTTPIGGFTAGESVKGLSVAELFAKLLGLVEQTDPTEEAIESIVTKIESAPEGEPVAVMQTITADGTLNEVQQEDVIIFDPSIADSPEASAEATKLGFYQIKNEEGEVVESGFQEIQIMSDEVYYSIALPKEIDYNTMITVQAYTGLGATKSWQEIAKLEMFSSRDNYDQVVSLCDEMGMSEDTIINLHNNGYTLWVAEEFPTGSMLRFVIN